MQTAGNHQVKDQPKVFVDSDGDALTDASQFPHDVTFHAGKGRLRSSEQKRARHPHVLKRLADNARFQGAYIGGDVRQFRHAYKLACYLAVFATSIELSLPSPIQTVRERLVTVRNSLPLSDFLFTNALHQIADLLQQKAREKVPDLAPSMERFEALFLSFGVGRSNP
jgi:hypothetical protein